jgi:hypothetical protein
MCLLRFQARRGSKDSQVRWGSPETGDYKDTKDFKADLAFRANRVLLFRVTKDARDFKEVQPMFKDIREYKGFRDFREMQPMFKDIREYKGFRVFKVCREVMLQCKDIKDFKDCKEFRVCKALSAVLHTM